ncbi:hypothetical protein [Luteolibacter sp. Populi]|uniref:hypothetical protein n=1 Tax=Luteolibacter sp. Populi TaxID=3230487 RepID=UPI0034656BFA
MRTPTILLAGFAFGASLVSAAPLAQDSFSYPAGDLTGQGGAGDGWIAAWDGANPVIVRTPGLSFADAFGNILTTTGSALNTADGTGTTTISSREVTDRDAETWISVLIQPQTTSSDFIGVSFYQNDLTQANARFAIENAGGKDLRLTRRVVPVLNSAAFGTTVGTTVLAVLHLVPDGGSGLTPDRIDVFFNPALDVEPGAPHASLMIDGLQFDRVRVAGAAGNSVLVDEIRIGATYADVTPFTAPTDPDSDADGLTNSQEAALGLDPFVSDAVLIAAVKANPKFVGLYSSNQIVDRGLRGPFLRVFGADSIDYSVDIAKGSGTVIESVGNPLDSPPSRNFLRLYLDTP